jgi:uncharacterized protein (DUF433 family)
LPADVVAHILQRYRSGATIPGIAEELGFPRTWVDAEVVKAGIERPRRAVGDSDITPQQLRREYEAGASVADLVYAHDLKRSSLLTALHRAGTDMRPPPAPSTPRGTPSGDAARIAGEEQPDGDRR